MPEEQNQSASASSLGQHRESGRKSLGIGVITVSDTRTIEDDLGGRLIVEHCERAGHRIILRRIVPDDIERLRDCLAEMLQHEGIQAVLATGGTGIARRDKTPEAFEPLYDAFVPGYGELFRALSYAEIGSSCILSRASCGRIGSRIVMTMPGSPAGVRLAMEKVIIPELGHLVFHAQSHNEKGS